MIRLDISDVSVGTQTFSSIGAAFGHVERAIGRGIDSSGNRVGAALLESLRRVASELERKHGRPWSASGGSGGSLYRRSGQGLEAIRDSIKVFPAARLSQVSGVIEAAGHMAIHETGGEIRARGGRYLTIPLPAALDSSGRPLRDRARDWGDAFSARSKRGNLLIFRREGREIVPLYVLKESIRIKPRLGLAEAVGEELPRFERRAFEEISEAIDAAA